MKGLVIVVEMTWRKGILSLVGRFPFTLVHSKQSTTGDMNFRLFASAETGGQP